MSQNVLSDKKKENYKIVYVSVLNKCKIAKKQHVYRCAVVFVAVNKNKLAWF